MEGDSKIRTWWVAARPHTLPASASPVIIGSGLALHDGVFAPVPAAVALISAALIQIGANVANDYFDAQKGVDTDERDGFTRVTQSGMLPPRDVRRGMATIFGTAFLSGLYLVFVGGLPILLIGVTGIISGVAYAGGPKPIGSLGLGDLFVFVFFGFLAVTGTYYVQAAYHLAVPLSTWIPAAFPLEALAASLPAGALSTGILVVNNIRDIETDRRAGKRTMAVVLGYRGSRVEYTALLALSYLVPLWFVTRDGFGGWVLLPLATFPLGIRVASRVWGGRAGDELDPALELTGKLQVIYSALLAVGMTV